MCVKDIFRQLISSLLRKYIQWRTVFVSGFVPSFYKNGSSSEIFFKLFDINFPTSSFVTKICIAASESAYGTCLLGYELLKYLYHRDIGS